MALFVVQADMAILVFLILFGPVLFLVLALRCSSTVSRSKDPKQHWQLYCITKQGPKTTLAALLHHEARTQNNTDSSTSSRSKDPKQHWQLYFITKQGPKTTLTALLHHEARTQNNTDTHKMCPF